MRISNDNNLVAKAVKVLADCGEDLFEEEFEVASGLAIDIIVHFTGLPIEWVSERSYTGEETIESLQQSYLHR